MNVMKERSTKPFNFFQNWRVLAKNNKNKTNMANKRIYISGPMTGLRRELYLQNFREAENNLRAKGYTRIVNPINIWACRWPLLYRIIGYRLTLWYDIQLLKRCDAIYMLNDWEQSKGACKEFEIAWNRKMSMIFQAKESDQNNE